MPFKSGAKKAEALKTKKNEKKEAKILEEESFGQNESVEQKELSLYRTGRMKLAGKSLHDLRTLFVEEPKQVMERRKQEARKPLQYLPPSSLRLTDADVTQHELIDMPKRPPWNRRMSAAQLEEQEQTAFMKWLQSIYDRFPVDRLNHFEHNIEVWRQLWRVCEMSNILLLIVDARHPLFHFPPSLYRFVTEELKKPLILCLNKVDLIPPEAIEEWIAFFKKRYPLLHVVPFSCRTAYLMDEVKQMEEGKEQSESAASPRKSIDRKKPEEEGKEEDEDIEEQQQLRAAAEEEEEEEEKLQTGTDHAEDADVEDEFKENDIEPDSEAVVGREGGQHEEDGGVSSPSSPPPPAQDLPVTVHTFERVRYRKKNVRKTRALGIRQLLETCKSVAQQLNIPSEQVARELDWAFIDRVSETEEERALFFKALSSRPPPPFHVDAPPAPPPLPPVVPLPSSAAEAPAAASASASAPSTARSVVIEPLPLEKLSPRHSARRLYASAREGKEAAAAAPLHSSRKRTRSIEEKEEDAVEADKEEEEGESREKAAAEDSSDWAGAQEDFRPVKQIKNRPKQLGKRDRKGRGRGRVRTVVRGGRGRPASTSAAADVIEEESSHGMNSARRGPRGGRGGRAAADGDEENLLHKEEESDSQEEEVDEDENEDERKDGEGGEREKKWLTIGLIGHPHVGKSSVINGLIGKKVVSIGRVPGHTKHYQHIHLSPNVRLQDCPGIVFPCLDVSRPLQILMGLVPIPQVSEPYSAVAYLAQHVDLVKYYGLKQPPRPALVPLPSSAASASASSQDASEPQQPHQEWSAFSICEAIALVRKMFTRQAGRPDAYRAANQILRDVDLGRVVLYFLPSRAVVSPSA